MLIDMAPPKIGVPIQIRLPEPLLAQIDARREATGQSRAETIRRMLAWAAKQPVTTKEQI